MACFIPFNNRNLDIIFFVFRPTVVLVDELVEALKQFSLCTESLGCVHSALLRSIHGNMILWYGAWMKRSSENKELLNTDLLSMLANISSMAILIDHSYFEAYAGESRDGSPAAKFSTGDTISMSAAVLPTDDLNQIDLSYAHLALFKSRFLKMDGAAAGVCLKSQITPRVVSLYVWKSLHSCYSWILNSDNNYRKAVLPYVDGLSLDVKYDIFKVVYVSGDSVINFQFYPPHRLLENDVQSTGGSQLVQD
ncbi:hypothetical protein RJ640_004125 [Escallonia rubra]|uniref:DUF7392 domain-containing protein n=1 Tax=Escallonia rubra TaxID=112253 RepID=A0AA88RIU0_9ASTE|nr:hypothetical protein RJ640_004125 [Escallonia rubra]